MTSLQWINIASCSAHRLCELRNQRGSQAEQRGGEEDTLDMALSKLNSTVLRNAKALL